MLAGAIVPVHYVEQRFTVFPNVHVQEKKTSKNILLVYKSYEETRTDSPQALYILLHYIKSVDPNEIDHRIVAPLLYMTTLAIYRRHRGDYYIALGLVRRRQKFRPLKEVVVDIMK